MRSPALAVIADVHGNAWALDAVLADIARQNIRAIVNLGDNANGPLDPARSVELLRTRATVHVRGNGDRMTGEGGAGARGSALFARARLDEPSLRWLRELPPLVQGEAWTAFHATPNSDEEYLLENVTGGATVLAPQEQIVARLGAVTGPLLLCGHTHLQRLVHLDDGRIILNPGSVGLPAYRDDTPAPHVVEAGSPHARYAIAHRDDNEWHVEFRCIVYDWHAAARAARDAGWTSWAKTLETGRC
jgi:hypothetical protein